MTPTLRSAALWFAPLALAIAPATTPAWAQETASTEAAPKPYLAADAVSYTRILAGPPAEGTPAFVADDAMVMRLQNVDDARFAEAELDARLLYPRFAEAFGSPISPEANPALVRLLDRAIADVNAVAFPAKDHFGRARPFQRLHLARACGMDNLPAPSPSAAGGSSYPSGHSTWGWTTAMVLARVRPERAEALMERAAFYAESRVVCGVHYPSDVAAGHAVAAAVVGALDGNAAFAADLALARKEAGQTPR